MHLIEKIRLPLASAKTSWQLVVLGALVGLLASLAIVALRLGIDVIQQQYMNIADDFSQENIIVRFLAPIIGAFVVLIIAHLGHQKYHRMGIPFVLHRQRKYYGYIPFGNSLSQFFSAMSVIASGFSVGREGPAVHIGAGAASLLSVKLRLPKNTTRVLTACGMAAGISASFNSPLAAVVFVLEVVVQHYRIHVFLPIMLSSLIGTAVSRAVFGDIHLYGDIVIPAINSTLIWPFLLIGLIIGLAAVLFNRSLLGIMKRTRDISMEVRLPIAGLIVGTIAWYIPQVMGSDLSALNIALMSHPQLTFLAMVLLGKFIATVSALGLGIPGGVIGVLYGLGALIGSLLIWTIVPYFPALAPYAPMAVLICMVALMGTSLNAPLAALVAVLELSENASIIFPSLLVVVPAILLSQQVFGLKSLFLQQLDLQRLGYKISPVIYTLQDTGVCALMRRKFCTLTASDAWQEHTSSLPIVVCSQGATQRYLMTSKAMGYNQDTQSLVNVPHLKDNATLAHAYELLSPRRAGFVIIVDQSTLTPIGLLNWRTLRKHLHREQGI